MPATLEKITSANHPRGWYPLAGWYLKNWREAKVQLAAGRLVRVAGMHNPMNRDQFDAFMRRALDRRINAKGGTEGAGRKYSDEYQTAITRDARGVNDYFSKRMRYGWNRWNTPEIQKRYGYLIREWREDC